MLSGWMLLQLVTAVSGLVLLGWLHRAHAWPDLSGGFVFIGGLVSMLWFLLWRERSLPCFVYAELRARGHDVCPGCGYLRRGLAAADPCPECGAGVPAARPGF